MKVCSHNTLFSQKLGDTAQVLNMQSQLIGPEGLDIYTLHKYVNYSGFGIQRTATIPPFSFIKWLVH